MKRIVWIGMLLVSIVFFPALAHAQTEAVITGVVTDSSGGVLPGVTVTAVHEATGNTFTSITDERGVFRMQARVGAYQILIELQGFQSVRAQATLEEIGLHAELIRLGFFAIHLYELRALERARIERLRPVAR